MNATLIFITLLVLRIGLPLALLLLVGELLSRRKGGAL